LKRPKVAWSGLVGRSLGCNGSGRHRAQLDGAAGADLQHAVRDNHITGVQAREHFNRAALARAEDDFLLEGYSGLLGLVHDVDIVLRPFGDDRNLGHSE
jgi:hypothetical protein